MPTLKAAVSVFVILMANSLLHAADRTALFHEGNSAYENGDYPAAIKAYEEALKQGHTVAVHFNLGNAYLKNEQPGLAVLHYERALLLDPRNPDVRANLDETLSQYHVPEQEKRPLVEWAYHLSLDSWAWLAVACLWGCLLVLLLPKCFGLKDTALQKVVALLFIAGLTACISGLAGYHLDRDRAIVTAQEAPLKVSPTENSPAGLYLQGGESIIPIREHNEHLLIEARNKQQGWLPKAQIARIWHD